MISVVVAARNEADNIEACLTALTRQTTKQPFEVILVSRSNDATEQLACGFLNRLDLQILKQKPVGRGAGRAMGFAAAKGQVILSTDGDSQVPPDWIENMLAHLDGQTVAVSGTCRINDCGPWTNWWFNSLQPWFMRWYSLSHGHYWLTGSNFAIKREIYDKSGGFDPAITDIEDIDLGFRVCKLGQIAMATDCSVMTSGKRFKNGVFRGLLPYARVYVGRYLLKQGNRYSRD